MTYRFTCQYCGSRFSLQQQLEEHERECGKVDTGQTERTADASGQLRKCKYCSKTFRNFGEYGGHRWAVHREEVLADLKKSRERRKADEAKIDATIAKLDSTKVSRAPAASTRRTARRPVENGHPCPTCGGDLPATTAQLVGELITTGLSEDQAFEAIKVCRRVLGHGASA